MKPRWRLAAWACTTAGFVNLFNAFWLHEHKFAWLALLFFCLSTVMQNINPPRTGSRHNEGTKGR